MTVGDNRISMEMTAALNTMAEQVRRCERWGKSHAELDTAINDLRQALSGAAPAPETEKEG